ncbi:MAG: ferredoxin domain-containing protein [bacterium]
MDIVKTAADLMALAARTAPKAKGQDHLEIKVIEGEDIRKLAHAMVEYAAEKNAPGFIRDGENVRKSVALLLVALKDAQPVGLNCGACGVPRCELLKAKQVEDAEFAGPICAWRLIDLGIALGSAAKTAGILNVDNRIMYRPGVLARRLGLIEGEIVAAIPLSASGKNIYFDR